MRTDGKAEAANAGSNGKPSETSSPPPFVVGGEPGHRRQLI